MTNEGLYEKISQDIVAAAKRHDATVVRVLRFCKSMLDNAAKDKKTALSNEEVLQILAKKVKQSREAATQFSAGNRQDLAEAEEEEIKIVSAYLPEQLSDEEIRKIVTEVATDLSATSVKDMGKVMGMVMKRVGSRADGAKVKQNVAEYLQG